MKYKTRRIHILYSEVETVCGLLLTKNTNLRYSHNLNESTCENCTRKRSIFSFDNHTRLATRKRKEEDKT